MGNWPQPPANAHSYSKKYFDPTKLANQFHEAKLTLSQSATDGPLDTVKFTQFKDSLFSRLQMYDQLMVQNMSDMENYSVNYSNSQLPRDYDGYERQRSAALYTLLERLVTKSGRLEKINFAPYLADGYQTWQFLLNQHLRWDFPETTKVEKALNDALDSMFSERNKKAPIADYFMKLETARKAYTTYTRSPPNSWDRSERVVINSIFMKFFKQYPKMGENIYNRRKNNRGEFIAPTTYEECKEIIENEGRSSPNTGTTKPINDFDFVRPPSDSELSEKSDTEESEESESASESETDNESDNESDSELAINAYIEKKKATDKATRVTRKGRQEDLQYWRLPDDGFLLRANKVTRFDPEQMNAIGCRYKDCKQPNRKHSTMMCPDRLKDAATIHAQQKPETKSPKKRLFNGERNKMKMQGKGKKKSVGSFTICINHMSIDADGGTPSNSTSDSTSSSTTTTSESLEDPDPTNPLEDTFSELVDYDEDARATDPPQASEPRATPIGAPLALTPQANAPVQPPTSQTATLTISAPTPVERQQSPQYSEEHPSQSESILLDQRIESARRQREVLIQQEQRLLEIHVPGIPQIVQRSEPVHRPREIDSDRRDDRPARRIPRAVASETGDPRPTDTDTSGRSSRRWRDVTPPRDSATTRQPPFDLPARTHAGTMYSHHQRQRYDNDNSGPIRQSYRQVPRRNEPYDRGEDEQARALKDSLDVYDESGTLSMKADEQAGQAVDLYKNTVQHLAKKKITAAAANLFPPATEVIGRGSTATQNRRRQRNNNAYRLNDQQRQPWENQQRHHPYNTNVGYGQPAHGYNGPRDVAYRGHYPRRPPPGFGPQRTDNPNDDRPAARTRAPTPFPTPPAPTPPNEPAPSTNYWDRNRESDYAEWAAGAARAAAEEPRTGDNPEPMETDLHPQGTLPDQDTGTTTLPINSVHSSPIKTTRRFYTSDITSFKEYFKGKTKTNRLDNRTPHSSVFSPKSSTCSNDRSLSINATDHASVSKSQRRVDRKSLVTAPLDQFHLRPCDTQAAAALINDVNYLTIDDEAEPTTFVTPFGAKSHAVASGSITGQIMTNNGLIHEVKIEPAYYHPDAVPIIPEHSLLDPGDKRTRDIVTTARPHRTSELRLTDGDSIPIEVHDKMSYIRLKYKRAITTPSILEDATEEDDHTQGIDSHEPNEPSDDEVRDFWQRRQSDELAQNMLKSKYHLKQCSVNAVGFNADSASGYQTKASPIELAHVKMGDVNQNKLTLAAKFRLWRDIDYSPKSKLNHNCEPCLKTKLKRSPHTKALERGHAIGDVMHLDILILPKKAPIDWKGNKLYFHMTDGFSDMTFGKMCKSSKQFISILNLIVQHLSAHGYTLGKIHTDSANELVGRHSSFYQEAAKSGIKMDSSAAGEQEANGIAESWTQKVQYMVSAALFRAKLDSKYIGFALEHFTHVYNWVPRPRLHGSYPHLIFYGQKISLKDVHVFGAYGSVMRRANKKALEGKIVSPVANTGRYIGDKRNGLLENSNEIKLWEVKTTKSGLSSGTGTKHTGTNFRLDERLTDKLELQTTDLKDHDEWITWDDKTNEECAESSEQEIAQRPTASPIDADTTETVESETQVRPTKEGLLDESDDENDAPAEKNHLSSDKEGLVEDNDNDDDENNSVDEPLPDASSEFPTDFTTDPSIGIDDAGSVEITPLEKYIAVKRLHDMKVIHDKTKNHVVTLVLAEVQLAIGKVDKGWYYLHDILRNAQRRTGTWTIVKQFLQRTPHDHPLCGKTISMAETLSNGKTKEWLPIIVECSPDRNHQTVIYNTGESSMLHVSEQEMLSYVTNAVQPVKTTGNRKKKKKATPSAENQMRVTMKDSDINDLLNQSSMEDIISVLSVQINRKPKDVDVPKDFYDMVIDSVDPTRDPWFRSFLRELDNLQATRCGNVFHTDELGKEYTIIPCRLVFKYKPFGEEPFKCRAVPQGCFQPPGSYDEITARTPEIFVLRFLLACMIILRSQGKEVHSFHFDIKAAFPNAPLDEKIAMAFPDFISEMLFGRKGMTMALDKSLYGLKQSAANWQRLLNTVLDSLGLKPSSIADCLRIRISPDNDLMLMVVQVDDLAGFSTNESDIADLKKRLQEKWTITDNGSLNAFLNLQIEDMWPSANVIHLHATVSFDRCLDTLDLTDVRPRATPATHNFDFAKASHGTPLTGKDAKRYLSIVFSALWFGRTVAPSAMKAVCSLTRYAPTEELMAAAIHIMGYLRTKTEDGIYFSEERLDPNCPIVPHLGEDYSSLMAPIGVCDADWHGKGEDQDGRPTTCSLVTLANGPVVFDTRLEKIVAPSTDVAELKAGNNCSGDVLYIERLLSEIGLALRPKKAETIRMKGPPSTAPFDVNGPGSGPCPANHDESYEVDDRLTYLPRPVYTDAQCAIQKTEKIFLTKTQRHTIPILLKAKEFRNEGLTEPRKIPRDFNPADEGTHVNNAAPHARNANFITNQPPRAPNVKPSLPSE
jgi:hypothetical protein